MLFGLLIEKSNQTGTVMLSDNIQNRRRQFLFTSEFDAILDVGDENKGAHAWRQFVVSVLKINLVLHKVLSFLYLANIVVQGADSRQERVCSHGLGRLLRKVAYHE